MNKRQNYAAINEIEDTEATRIGTELEMTTNVIDVIEESDDKMHESYTFKPDQFESVVSEEGTLTNPQDKGDYSPTRSNIFAIMSAFLFGFANFLLAKASKDYGVQTQVMQTYSLLAMGILFHLVKWMHHTCTKKQRLGYSYFSAQNSSYYDKVTNVSTGQVTYKLNKLKCMVPVFRGFVQGAFTLLTTLAFYFGSKSGINSGIISTLFVTSVPFTAILFQCLYGQKMGPIEWIGCLFVISSVALIGLGGAPKVSGQATDEDAEMYKYIAIMFGLIVGGFQTFNAQNVNWIIKSWNFPAAQMTFEGAFFKGVVLIPFWIYYTFIQTEKQPYFSQQHYLEANLSIICNTLALFCFSEATRVGKGATVQAIYNSKVPIQTAIESFVTSMLPTATQLGGLGVGIFGVSLFVLKKSKK